MRRNKPSTNLDDLEDVPRPKKHTGADLPVSPKPTIPVVSTVPATAVNLDDLDDLEDLEGGDIDDLLDEFENIGKNHKEAKPAARPNIN